MAGRLQIALTPDELATLLRIQREAWPDRVKLPRYNVAPRQAVPVLRADGELVAMRWGFPQPWKPKPFDAPPLINAKSEEAEGKATWKAPIRERRCVVPVTGFYEWEAKERPLCFRRADRQPLLLAGVWGAFDWGEKLGWPCVSVLTCAPNATVAPVHDRMPVVLEQDALARWFGDDWRGCLAPAAEGVLEAVPVSSRVNHIDQDDEGLLVADWART